MPLTDKANEVVELIIYVNYYDEQRTQKPTKPEARAINGIDHECAKPRYIDTSKWLEILLHGGTTRPCALAGNSDANFISGQTFLVDIDNKDSNEKRLPIDKQLKPEQAVQLLKANGLNPICVYLSFSAVVDGDESDRWYRYRIVFVGNRPLTDIKQWEHCRERIVSILPSEVNDPSTKNAQNLFFGTNKSAVYMDESATVDVDALLSDYVPVTAPTAKTKRTKKTRPSLGDRSKEIAEAIKNHDAKFIRKATGRTKPIELNNADDFFFFIYHEISLAELFGVNEGGAFCCVFPDKHGDGDSNPSASVYRTHYGTWQYYCFTEKLKLNLKQLVELLGKYKSEHQALEFIKEAFNLRIAKSAWTEEQTANIDRILDCLARTDETSFAMLCPTASNNIRFAKGLYMQVLVIAKSRIYPNQVTTNGDILFYMTNSQIAKDTGKEEKKCQKYLKMLMYHGLLVGVPESEVPNNIMQKALEKCKPFVDASGKTRKPRHPSFYSIPSWVYQRLEYIESQGKRWKAHGYRMDSISYEVFARSEGYEVASRLYPQTSQYTTKSGEVKQRTTSGYSDRRHSILTDIVMTAITDQGYCTEQQAIEKLSEITGYQAGKKQLLRSITDIMTANGLTKVRANKDLKQRFGITCKGYPNILIVAE